MMIFDPVALVVAASTAEVPEAGPTVPTEAALQRVCEMCVWVCTGFQGGVGGNEN